MTDMCESRKVGFKKAEKTDSNLSNSLGINGAWVVSSWNMYTEYKSDNYTGIEVYNCCGNFVIAIKNEK